jgi:hypothetical protein
VKSIIQAGKEVFEVLHHAVYRQDLFDKGSTGYDFGAFGYVSLILVVRVNLAEPAGITVTGRPDENLGMEIAEVVGLKIKFWISEHNLIY